jgi:hypothetical protein
VPHYRDRVMLRMFKQGMSRSILFYKDRRCVDKDDEEIWVQGT